MFAKDSAVYKDMAWGTPKTIKPLSYIHLDSLYAIKYNLEQQSRRDVELESEINIQRQIALNDTAPILYLEDHLFSVTKDGKTTVYSSAIESDRNNIIRNSTINASNNLATEMIEEFKIYTFEESFLNRGYAPEQTEQVFYRRFKTRADQMTGDERDRFINHTLDLMQRARKARSLETKDMLMEIVRQRVHGAKRSNILNEKFESMEELVNKSGGTNTIIGFQVVYSYQKVVDGLTTSFRYFVELSDYLEIQKFVLT